MSFDPNNLPLPPWYDPTGGLVMDVSTNDPLPSKPAPENQISCALQSVDLLRRAFALVIYRYNLPENITFGKFELDHAPVRTLVVKSDSAGNATITIDPHDMGS